MKISTEINSMAKHLGFEKAIEEVAKAGFDAWDFTLTSMANFDWQTGKATLTDSELNGNEYKKYARKLRKIGEDYGIHCNQSHAPFPTRDKVVLSTLKRAIECTAEAGGKICIIHPDNYKSAEENAEMYFNLLPFAKECGVKIAAENMWCWPEGSKTAARAACSDHEDFIKHLNVVNDDYFVACLDIGHASMAGLNTSAEKMIHTLGDKLQALHIHDNDLLHDSHQIPFSMNIDFQKVVKALKDIDYKGYFTLECSYYLAGADKEDVIPGIKNLALSAKKLALMFDNLS